MDEERKKQIMIGVILVCLAGVGVVLYSTLTGGGSGGINSIPQDEITWVKCSNPACNAEYEMPKREYYKEAQKAVVGFSQGALICKECGKKSLFRAIKCENCGKVFFRGASGPNDFADRCPFCKHSAEEDKRKSRTSGTNN